MREFSSNCVIGRVPQLRQTLIKFNNMSVEDINSLKRNIINNLKQNQNSNDLDNCTKTK